MTTNNQNDGITKHLINQLASIATNANNNVDGASRIKAAVMIAYLSGRPAPTIPADGSSYALLGFRQLQQEFGIQLTDLTDEGS